MIARFYDPQKGVVKIDAEDVRSYKQKSLRKQISFVLQETLLFRAPVWQNIAYGRPEASREEILQAAKLANADEFIRNTPQQYDTRSSSSITARSPSAARMSNYSLPTDSFQSFTKSNSAINPCHPCHPCNPWPKKSVDGATSEPVFMVPPTLKTQGVVPHSLVCPCVYRRMPVTTTQAS